MRKSKHVRSFLQILLVALGFGQFVNTVAACTINITSPTTASVFNAPATVNVAGNHNCPDFTVYLYDNGSQVAAIPGGDGLPRTIFNHTLTNVAAGTHRLTAYIGGAVNVTSAPVEFTVRPPRAANYYSQSVPTTMVAGRTYAASIQMINAGSATWTEAAGYKLGSQNPENNGTWGISRVGVSGAVATNQTASFNFNVKAPAAGGTYNFQWKMVDEGEAWFGAVTPNVAVNVVAGSINASPNLCTIPSGSTTCSTTVNWSSNAANSQVWVSALDNSGMQLFAAGQSGAQPASWVSAAGHRFHLKVGTETLATVEVRGNPAPTVAISKPTQNQVFQAGTAVVMSASASDSGGSVQRVEFLVDGAKVSEAPAAPYTYTWPGTRGAHVLTAKAIDNQGAATVSAPISFTVNGAPTVTLTAPTNGTTADPPATFTLKAQATDDFGVSSVEFFLDGNSISVDTVSPYEHTLTGLSAGTHYIHAVVRDTHAGSASSATSMVTVSHVIGNVDALVPGAGSNYVLRGWACSTGLNASIGVHLYVGGAAGSGTFVGSYSANLTSEPAVASNCAAQGAAYRFEIPVTLALRQQHPDKPLYVHGISPIGRSNNLLSGSGAYRTPEDAISSSSIEYDELGQVIGRRGQNGQYIRYRYDANGNVIKIIDSQNKETLLGYDARNRRIKMTDAKGGVTAMTYDVGDRLKQVTDPRGKVTTFVNDGFGDLWETSSPDAGTTRYSYDVLGNPSLMVRNGIQTIYEHDGLGRLKLVTAAGSSLHYLYDGCANGKGLLCQISGSTGSVSYTYTPEGLPATQTNVMPDGGSASVGHSYDGLGRLTGISYPDGTSVGYGYTAGRPTTMTVTVAGTTTTVVSDARYLPFSGPAGWSYGNGLNRTYSYDGDRRIVGVATGTATGIWQSLTYAYDNLNRIIAITNGVNADLTHGFGYDELSRITSVQTAGVTHAFEYDANGNRTVEVRNGVSSNYEISPEGNRLLGVAGGTPKSFSYDLVGNVVNDGSNSYTYDSFNRMTSVLANGTLTNYVLNGLGERIYKETAGVKQWFVYGPMNSLLAEHKSGQGWSSYAYFNGEPVAMIRGGVVNYIHGDYLGRPEIVTNGTRTVIWRAENAAFGRTVTIDAIGGLNIGFPGQYHDAETGNWNNGYRDYDDRLGRYIQSDPIGLDGGMNTYVYAGGNPISFVDPLGLQATVGPGIPVGGMPRASDACTDAALADSILNLTPGIGAIKAFSEEPNSLDTMSGVMSTTTVMTEVGTRRADAASNARLQDLERWGRNRREQTALRTSIQANSGLNKFLRGIGRNLGILSLGIEAAKFSEAAEKCWCKARGK